MKFSMGQNTNKLLVGNWSVNYSDSQLPFNNKLQAEGKSLIKEWVSCFSPENTWVQNNLHIPSLIVRLDCVIENDQLRLYEVEERPAGIGFNTLMNPLFAAELKKVQSTWPKFEVVVSSLRNSSDDHLWAPVTNNPSDLVLVRAEPSEFGFHYLESRSVSSLKQKGNKSYGLAMNLWREVTKEDALDWDKGFVLKPKQGSKTRDIWIWDPGRRRAGSYGQNRIIKELEKKPMYCQDLIEPMASGHPNFPCLILRVFYGYDCIKQDWVYIGGMWNARPNLKVHGATDTAFGSVIPTDG